jgi:copper oxidase (laccase) domain-containing protein
MSPLRILRPDWPAPANVHAFTTTRQGGFSQAPYDQFNLGAFAGEDLPTGPCSTPYYRKHRFGLSKCMVPMWS